MNNTHQHRYTDLFYGHLGLPIYDQRRKSWIFPRQNTPDGHLTPSGLLKTLIEPTQPSSKPPKLGYRAKELQAQELVRRFPELSSLEGLLEHGFGFEEGYEDEDAFVALKSSLLAYGFASTNATETNERVPLLAVATGPRGELVRLFPVDDSGRVDTNLKVNGIWRGNGTPILQLCLAGAEESGRKARIAVRQEFRISILEPVQQDPASPFAITSDDVPLDVPPSSLRLCEVARLGAGLTPNASFVDVALDPWKDDQFAAIDKNGRWSVCHVATQPDGNDGRTCQRVLSHVFKPANDDNYDKGWFRLTWIRSSQYVCVASRRTAQLFKIGSEAKVAAVVDVAMKNSSDWILDLQRCPSDPSLAYILTSSRIFIISVSTRQTNRDIQGENIHAKILLAWRHFRDPGDASLRMSLGSASSITSNESSKAATIVLLFSKNVGLITVFTFRTDETCDMVISDPDPYMLRLPSTDVEGHGDLQAMAIDQGKPMSDVLIYPIHSGYSGAVEQSNGAETSQTKRSSVQLHILGPDHRLLQDVLIWPEQVSNDTPTLLDIAHAEDISVGSHEMEGNDFIVPDSIAGPRLASTSGRTTRFDRMDVAAGKAWHEWIGDSIMSADVLGDSSSHRDELQSLLFDVELTALVKQKEVGLNDSSIQSLLKQLRSDLKQSYIAGDSRGAERLIAMADLTEDNSTLSGVFRSLGIEIDKNIGPADVLQHLKHQLHMWFADNPTDQSSADVHPSLAGMVPGIASEMLVSALSTQAIANTRNLTVPESGLAPLVKSSSREEQSQSQTDSRGSILVGTSFSNPPPTSSSIPILSQPSHTSSQSTGKGRHRSHKREHHAASQPAERPRRAEKTSQQLADVVNQWVVGMDPEQVDWAAAMAMFEQGLETSEPAPEDVTAESSQRSKEKQKQQVERQLERERGSGRSEFSRLSQLPDSTQPLNTSNMRPPMSQPSSIPNLFSSLSQPPVKALHPAPTHHVKQITQLADPRTLPQSQPTNSASSSSIFFPLPSAATPSSSLYSASDTQQQQQPRLPPNPAPDDTQTPATQPVPGKFGGGERQKKGKKRKAGF